MAFSMIIANGLLDVGYDLYELIWGLSLRSAVPLLTIVMFLLGLFLATLFTFRKVSVWQKVYFSLFWLAVILAFAIIVFWRSAEIEVLESALLIIYALLGPGVLGFVRPLTMVRPIKRSREIVLILCALSSIMVLFMVLTLGPSGALWFEGLLLLVSVLGIASAYFKAKGLLLGAGLALLFLEVILGDFFGIHVFIPAELFLASGLLLCVTEETQTLSDKISGRPAVEL